MVVGINWSERRRAAESLPSSFPSSFLFASAIRSSFLSLSISLDLTPQLLEVCTKKKKARGYPSN